MAASSSETWDRVLPLLTEGRLVPFLGAGGQNAAGTVTVAQVSPQRTISPSNLGWP